MIERVVRGDLESLRAALDRLGVGHREEFLVSPVADEDVSVDGNRLGAFARDPETSRQAALDNYPRSGKQRHQVFVAVAEAGERGAISDEIADALGIRLYSAKPRLIELRRGGWVRKNGKTRPSETNSQVDVHVLTEKGAREFMSREGRPPPGYTPPEGQRADLTPPADEQAPGLFDPTEAQERPPSGHYDPWA